jgi:hypothetical protein
MKSPAWSYSSITLFQQCPKKYYHLRVTKDVVEPESEVLLPGDKHCEHKMGLTERGEPCGFFDPNVWLRGVADLIIIDGDTAKIVDYKTGKSSKFADTKQLDLMALCTFAHFPEVDKIKGGLLFLVCNDLVKRTYQRSDVLGIMQEWSANYSWLSKTYQEDVWNPKPNFTCKAYCPVVKCPHNGRNG